MEKGQEKSVHARSIYVTVQLCQPGTAILRQGCTVTCFSLILPYLCQNMYFFHTAFAAAKSFACILTLTNDRALRPQSLSR